MTREEGRKLIHYKIEDFKINELILKKKGYGETNIRTNYIDVLFEALGWNMKTHYEVGREHSQKDNSGTKKVDYAFKVNRKLKFFVEAKEPSVDLEKDKEAIYQAKRYAYSTNGKAPIVILTDFEEFRVFNVLKSPIKENTDRELLKPLCFRYEDYYEKWDTIWNAFSKEAVEGGSIERLRGKIDKNTKLMDADFLEQIIEWRETLARNIAIRNADLSVDDLNEAVQRILDRLIFIRNLEDREIEPENTLLDATKNNENIYQSLVRIFSRLDKVYNGLLFKKHFSEELVVDDKTIKDVIKSMSYPVSPFQFDVIEPEILGRIYEKFLGSKIRLTEKHQAKIEEKIKGLTPDEIKKINIVDPACGSGSFLLGAYSYILDYHTKWYLENKTNKSYKSDYYFDRDGELKVTLEKRGDILRNNIYGVDIDKEATEVAIMSLYLKMLDDGFDKAQTDLFFVKGHVLPDMTENIKCGNSLIGTDYFSGQLEFDIKEMKEIKPFDWEKEFKGVFQKIPKNLNAYHITWVTHNSRVSERMQTCKVQKGEPVYLDENDELVVSQAIFQIVQEDNVKILAYNICRDHVHILLVCEESEIPAIIQKMKSVSARKVNIAKGITVSKHTEITREHAPLLPESDDDEFSDRGETQNHLWAQKYDCKVINDDTCFANTINYIENNRLKHELPDNPKLASIIKQIVCNYDEAFNQFNLGGFDCVIGNPPYGAELNNNERKFLEQKFRLSNTDTACLFLGLLRFILKDIGINGFIVPKALVYSSNWQIIREELINHLSILVDCEKVWKEVKLEQVIMIYDKSKSEKQYLSSARNEEKIFLLGNIAKNTFQEFGFYLNGISDRELKIGIKIRLAGKYLNNFVVNQRGAMLQKRIQDNGNYLVLGGKQLNRYSLLDESKGFIHEKHIDDEKAFIKKDSLLVQNIVAHIANPIPHIKIIATIPEERASKSIVILDTINQLQNISCLKSNFLLAIINSNLVSWYSYRFIFGKAIRTMHFDSPVSSRIPCPDLDLSNSSDKKYHDNLVSLVDQMLATQKEYHSVKSESDKTLYSKKNEMLDKNIDELVYQLYGLTEEEIRIVEEGV